MNKKSGISKAVQIAGIIDEGKIALSAENLRALTHDLRLRIVDYIDKNPATCVNNIYNSLGLEQSITSQHLKILRFNNIVITKREGKQILYTLNYKKIKKLANAIKIYLG